MKLSEIELKYSSNLEKRIKIQTSKVAYDILFENWDKETIELREEVKVLYLNRDNILLGIYTPSIGGVASSVIDNRHIFSVAMKCNASGMILAHNHPSGSLKPSENDLHLTKKISEAGNLLDVKLLDHLIITKNGYYSFVDEGKI